ncbi:MAG: Pantothenate precursors transporter PanS [Turneriella sp.]|nr:Pantothenate precursors transporter PanS [Turneriella sp.]
MIPIDQIQLNFNPASLILLNVILGFVMFGVALDMHLRDFKEVFVTPKPVLIGLLAQFIFLPAFTWVMTMFIKPAPSIALGMILVAACPGGNVSNFITHFSKGNTALSVTMTAISTAIAIFMTPFNLAFWGSLNPDTKALLTQIAVDPLEMLASVFMLLGVPLILGLLISHKAERVAIKLRKPMRWFSLIVFGFFVAGALAANWSHFLNYVGYVVFYVFAQNGIALLTGYTSAWATRLPEADRRAVAIEVGIQNSGLGLTLIFTFFHGLGGMALIAAWWGVWHIISGMTLGFFWSKFPPRTAT